MAFADRGAGDARVVGIGGILSNVGVLQIRAGDANGNDFGTICGINLAGADVACKQMGYDFGTVSSTPCSNYGGRSVCGAKGSLVAAQNLQCSGEELELSECTWQAPSIACESHDADSVVYCGRSRAGSFDLKECVGVVLRWSGFGAKAAQ